MVENIIVVGILKEVRVYSGKYNTVQTSVLFKIRWGEELYINQERAGQQKNRHIILLQCIMMGDICLFVLRLSYVFL